MSGLALGGEAGGGADEDAVLVGGVDVLGELDFLAAWLLPVDLLRSSAAVSEPALDGGRSSRRDSTLASYGLKASLLPPCAGEGAGGLHAALDALAGLDRLLAGLGPGRSDEAGRPLDDDDDFLAADLESCDSGLDGESAPIWLQVCASRASGLFLASSCEQRERRLETPVP